MDKSENMVDVMNNFDLISEEELDFSVPEEDTSVEVKTEETSFENKENDMEGVAQNNNFTTQSEEIKPKIEVLPNEIGRVKDIGADNVIIGITSTLAFENNLVDQHVIFRTNQGNSIVGIVKSINSEVADVKLIGEISINGFIAGVITKPSIGTVCFAANEIELKMIVSDNKQNDTTQKILIGNMPLYNNTPAYIPVNTFFANHFSILGNSGSGKSCGVARLLQNVFYGGQPPRNASVFIFDAYGEYENALSIPNNYIYFKKYTTNVKDKQNTLIKLPLWLMDMDDIALLLDVDDVSQLPIIEKALRLVTIFSGDEKTTRVYKNDIIAKTILDVLYSGGSASQIHDQIFAILTSFNTPDLNLESQVMQPGYIRTLRQCLIIDKEGKIGEIQLVSEFLKKFVNDSLKLELPDGSIPYTLEQLKDAFDFALISEGILKSNKIFDKTNALKVRLESLLKSEYSEYFRMDKYVDRNTFIKELITAQNGMRAQIININISYLDDRLAKTICKIYSKLLFDFTSKLQNRGTFPVHVILEEAHRYVQKDSDTKILGYNIFDRIAKEGRKYGVILGLISQRPSELSETVLSQCSNFLIFKMQHPHDVSFIRQMVPYITDDIVEKMKGLQPGTCVSFGSAFKLPTIIKMSMPNPQPASQSVDLSRIWY